MRKHTLSFKNAFNGILTALKTQLNLRIHLLATVLVLYLGFFLKITKPELLTLLLTIAMVIVAEMANTAIEFLGDAITLERNEFIKNAKDVSAGAVFITSAFSVLIGIVIFTPYLLNL